MSYASNFDLLACAGFHFFLDLELNIGSIFSSPFGFSGLDDFCEHFRETGLNLTLTPRPHFISSNLVWAATNIEQNKHFSRLSLHIVVFASNLVAGAFEFALCHDSVSAGTLTNE